MKARKEGQNRPLTRTRLSKDTLLNFAFVALIIYFIVFFWEIGKLGNVCMAGDFCGYYSAGQIMNDGQVADIYNLDLLQKYQSDLVYGVDEQFKSIEPAAMLYLPIFLLPFRLFALLDLSPSLFIWEALNAIVLVWYLFFFSKKMTGKALSFQTLILILISFPVLRNFMDGQVNVFLLICVGEFLRAIQSDQPVKAGLWLGGILIKPHLLILILPFLLIQKKYKVLLGFIYAALALFGLSYLLIGWQGFIAFKDVILEAAGGGASSFHEVMMNWRATGYYVTKLTTPVLGEIVFIGGSLLTGLVPLVAFRKQLSEKSPMFVIALLGILAATTAVTYHAHVHTSMILIPVLLYLYFNEILSRKLLIIWVMITDVSSIFQFLVYVSVSPLIAEAALSDINSFLYGHSMMVANLILLGWAVQQKIKSDQAARLQAADRPAELN